jgi:hypothetical protein
MLRAAFLVAALGVAVAPAHAQSVLHDNGGVVTAPGAAPGGAGYSAVPTTLGASVTGHAAVIANDQRVADDFVVPAGGWRVSAFEFEVFQPGAPASPAPYDRAHVRVWDGPPGAPGSTVLFGDLATDRLASAVFANAYRVTGLGTSLDRPIHRVRVATAALELAAGTYWIEWQVGSPTAGGPYAVPVTRAGQHSTGNARQFAGDWRDVRDGAVPQDLSFVVTGSAGPWPDPLFQHGFED